MADTNGTSDKVKEQAEKLQIEAAEELKELGRELRTRAEAAREEVVKQLHNVAASMRKEVRDRKADPNLKANVDRMASGLEKAATYLNSRNLDQIGEDATKVVRTNPWRTLAVIFIVGLIIGVFLRRGD